MEIMAVDGGRVAAVLRSARLMLYAWKAARRNFGLADDHRELNDTIADIESLRSDIEALSVDESQHG